MITGRNRFNIYLAFAIGAGGLCGCRTTEEKETPYATFRVHMEATGEVTSFTARVPVYREKPVMINADKGAFLTEANVTGAKVVDALGGFALEIQLDRQGTWLLESYTTSNPGKRMVIFSQFGLDLKEGRWLGAPVIARRNSRGVLTFSPDATREEAELIALGLNNFAEKSRKESVW